jgi:hypothetical protein
MLCDDTGTTLEAFSISPRCGKKQHFWIAAAYTGTEL